VILVLDVILTECRSKKSVFDLEARVAWYFQLCQKVFVLWFRSAIVCAQMVRLLFYWQLINSFGKFNFCF